MKTSVKYGVIAPQMFDAAAKFRSTAVQPGTDPHVAEVLLKVAQDYDNCAEYIEALEERISEMQIHAIRGSLAADFGG
jgi:hypothetical protein